MMKRTIPLLITAAAGLVIIVSFFVPPAEPWGTTVADWFNILAAFAFILGGGNLLMNMIRKVSNRSSGWGYAAITIAAFVITIAIGVLKVGSHPVETFPTFGWSGKYDDPGTGMKWILDYLYTPLSSTMFAMLAFYVASAAFRAFRAKNVEAILLLGTAFIILLGRTYAGVYLTSWITDNPASWWHFLRLEFLSDTIRDLFTTVGTRAIMIGIALGIASTSLKILLGIDRSYLGSKD